MIVCAGSIEQFDFALPIGIGLVQSASNLTKLILEQKPKTVCFMGTVGSYGKYKVFDIVQTSNAVNIENSFLTGESYTPLKMEALVEKTASHETVVNSSNYITTSEIYAKAYIDKGVDLENMEFYSVVEVCKLYNIEVKGIFVVTNYCNAEAHETFKKNHNLAMQKLSEYVQSEALCQN